MENEHGGNTMAGNVVDGNGRRRSGWRIVAWTTAAALWLAPLVAMQFSDEVQWGVLDFALTGVLLFGTGITAEVIVRTSRNNAYRAAAGVALAASLMLVWLTMGVSIIGRDGDPANLMYFGVLAIGGLGAVNARFRAAGMVRVLRVTAIAQALVAAIALVFRLGIEDPSWPLEILALTGFFVTLWLGSASLFGWAAEGEV
jgi:hypothetical protein